MDVLGPDLVIPDVAVTEPPSELTASSAVLHGTVDPLSEQTEPTGEGASCVFEYGTSTAYGEKAECAEKVAAGNAPAPVHSVRLTGLSAGTTYYYRLAATNSKGTNKGQGSADEGHFTTRGPAFVGLASASSVTATSVSLNATVDPNGAATSYFFQYSTGDTEGCTSVPASCMSMPAAPGSPLGAGSEPLPVPPVHVGGLSPATEYHYRVVAVSEVEVTPGHLEVHDFVGPDLTFTTQGPGVVGLPDGRSWEMVSPPVKDGALIESIDGGGSGAGEAGVIQAALDGERFSFLTDFPTESEPRGTGPGTQVLSTRSPGGWGSRDLALPHAEPTGQSIAEGNEYRFFSEDLSLAVVQPFGAFDPALSGEASEQTAFLHTNYAGGVVCGDGCYRPLVTGAAGFANVPAGTRFGLGEENGLVKPCPPVFVCGPEFVGASGDAQHVVLEAEAELAPPGGNLYEWSAGKPANEQLAAVSVLPAGEGGGGTFATLGGTQNSDARNAISSDGSRVFFEASSGLYMREPYGGAGGMGVTLRLGAGGAVFQDASVDGSRVFYEEAGSLYACAITLEASGEPVCKLSDLGAAEGVVGASVDGSYVYVAGPAGVFLHHYDSEVGHEGWEAPRLVAASADGLNFGELTKMMARVSPNGQWLAFMSDQSLTGYDNLDARSGHPDEEVYLYSAETGKLVCASCNPSGARPIGSEYGEGGNLPVVGGNGVWPRLTWLAALVPGWTPYRAGKARYQSRYLSNSGRLFFDARDPLVPQAVNENWDVYEWEPQGVPSGQHPCASSTTGFVPSAGGCVALISSGESPDESAFLDASETGGEGPNGEQLQQGGGDVFFMTTAKLAPQDVDDSYDVYDAHECTTASPCLPAPPTHPPACTSADQCRAAPTPEPALFAAPPSATFNGPGNLAPPGVVVKPKARVLTRAQKLAGALKVCRKEKPKSRRASCEKAARQKYGRPKKKGTKK